MMDTNKPPRARLGMRAHPIRSRTYLPRLFAGFWRLASLQWRIGVLRFRMRSRQILLASVLLLSAAACALIGLIFLEVAVFQLLCNFLAPQWVTLIYSLVHLLIAAIVAMSARGVLQTLDDDLAPDLKEPKK